MLVQKNLIKYKRPAGILLITCLFLCCLYAFHDMQTAEGIGLFFAMQLGMDNRGLPDGVVDILCMATFVLLISLPCMLLRHKTIEAYVRLLIVYLAVVPQLSLAGVLAVIRGEERVFLWEMDWKGAFGQWFYQTSAFLQVWLPLFLVLAAVAEKKQCLVLEKWHKVCGAVLLVLLILLVCVPGAAGLILYLCGYLGVVLAFDCWERLLDKAALLRKWAWIPFGLLLLKGIYRIVVLVSQV